MAKNILANSISVQIKALESAIKSLKAEQSVIISAKNKGDKNPSLTPALQNILKDIAELEKKKKHADKLLKRLKSTKREPSFAGG